MSQRPMTERDRPFRLAIVTSHPIQYAAPLYAYLNEDPRLEVSVLFCADVSLRGAADAGFGRPVAWDIDLLSGYRAIFLGERARQRQLGGFWSLICPELVLEIRRSRYDAVWVHGQQFAAYVLAFALAKLHQLPVLTRADTRLHPTSTPLRSLARRCVLGLQYRAIERFLAVGSANARYYESYGVPSERIFMAPLSVDNDRFMRAAELSVSERTIERRRLGVADERPLLLFASKLMRRKHPDDLLHAAAALVARGLALHVVIAGSGEMEAELRALASGLELERLVTFTGFLNQSELPRLYAACDVFVLPAEDEPWGLIVNEVMCAGLPVVVAEGVGCVPDLVVAGETGFTCTAGDPRSLARALESLVVDPSLRRRLGDAGRRRIAGWGYEQCRQGVLAAIAGLRGRDE